jgi:hypothetical protein
MSTTRIYGSIIAVVSGGYSLYLSTAGVRMSGPAWFMLALGIITLVHGVILLTRVAQWLRTVSGPLMIAYSVLMLANQGSMATGMMRIGTMMTPTWDAGMVAIAALMLASGAIMTARKDMM